MRAEETAREWTVRGLRDYHIGNIGCETGRWSRPCIASAADGSARKVVASEATAGLRSLARPVGLAMSRPRRVSRPCRLAPLTMTHVGDKREPTLDRALVPQWQEGVGD